MLPLHHHKKIIHAVLQLHHHEKIIHDVLPLDHHETINIMIYISEQKTKYINVYRLFVNESKE